MDNRLIGILLSASFITLTENCLQGWIPDKDYDVCFKLFHSQPKTWSEAREFCANLHKTATLSMTHTFRQHKRMIDKVFTNRRREKFVWLGAYHNGNNWEWVDRSELFKGNFEWGSDRSKNAEEQMKVKYCLKTSIKNGRLSSALCDNDLSFVCSMQDSTEVTPAPSHGSLTSHNDVIIPSVLIPVCILIIVGIVIFVLRRKGQSTAIKTSDVRANQYEDLRGRVPNDERCYSNLFANEDSNNESRSSAMTSHSAGNNRVFSVMNHDYSSAHFPSNTEILNDTNTCTYEYV